LLSKTHKTSKTSGKREKIACSTMGHLPKLKNNKNGGLGECRRKRSGWCLHADLKLVVTSPLPLVFTKMPFCHI